MTGYYDAQGVMIFAAIAGVIGVLIGWGVGEDLWHWRMRKLARLVDELEERIAELWDEEAAA